MSHFWALAWRAALMTTALALGGEQAAQGAASARLFYGKASDVEGCADEAELRRAIANRVGYDPIFAIAPNSVTVSITRDHDRLVADVTLADRNGVLLGLRTLRAPAGQCAELTDAIALTVAIALDTLDVETRSAPADAAGAAKSADPDHGSEALEAPPPPAPATPGPLATSTAPSSETPRPASRAARDEGAPSRRSVEVGVGVASAFYGLSPAPSLGATAFGALRWARFEVGIEGWADLPASSPASALATARARTSFLGVGPTACLHFGDVFVCALSIVGSLRAEAPGVPGASARGSLEVLGGGRIGVSLPLGRGLAVRGSVDLLADPTAPTLRASGQVIWQAPPVVGAAQIGLALGIP
jgi:hypothetical protein